MVRTNRRNDKEFRYERVTFDDDSDDDDDRSALTRHGLIYQDSIALDVSKSRLTLVVKVAYLGWVDYDFGHSSVCLVLLGQMGIWQNRPVNRARWWNIKNQSQPNQGTQPPESTCTRIENVAYLKKLCLLA